MLGTRWYIEKMCSITWNYWLLRASEWVLQKLGPVAPASISQNPLCNCIQLKCLQGWGLLKPHTHTHSHYDCSVICFHFFCLILTKNLDQGLANYSQLPKSGQTPAFVNKSYWNMAMPIDLHILSVWVCVVLEELRSSWKTVCPAKPKNLLV